MRESTGSCDANGLEAIVASTLHLGRARLRWKSRRRHGTWRAQRGRIVEDRTPELTRINGTAGTGGTTLLGLNRERSGRGADDRRI
jgi:hypothetical protein